MPRGTATSRRGGGTRAGQSGRGSCPRRRPPRRRGGTPGEPAHRGVSGGLRPRQRAPNTLGRRRAGRARRRPPRMSAAGWQESAHGRHFGDTHGDGPTARPIPRPCPPPRHRPPGRPPRPSTQYGNERPVVRRRLDHQPPDGDPACCTRMAPHAPHPRRGAADEQSAHNATAARRRQRRRRATPTGRTRVGRARPNGPATRPGGPAPPPTAPPPIAQPRTRGGPLCDPRRTGADGRGGIGDDAAPDRALSPVRGGIAAPAAHAPSTFCLSRLLGPAVWLVLPQPPVFNSRGARAQARGPIPSTDQQKASVTCRHARTARFARLPVEAVLSIPSRNAVVVPVFCPKIISVPISRLFSIPLLGGICSWPIQLRQGSKYLQTAVRRPAETFIPVENHNPTDFQSRR